MPLQMKQQLMTTMIMMMGGRSMFSSLTMRIPLHFSWMQREHTNDCSEGDEEEHKDMNNMGKDEEKQFCNSHFYTLLLCVHHNHFF